MLRLDTTDPNFSRDFARVVDARRDADSDVAGVVQDILRTVRTGKDSALVQYSQRFDGYSLIDDADWVITPERCKEAYDALEAEQRDALQLAADRIRAYHEAQLPENRDYKDAAGARLGAIWCIAPQTRPDQYIVQCAQPRHQQIVLRHQRDRAGVA